MDSLGQTKKVVAHKMFDPRKSSSLAIQNCNTVKNRTKPVQTGTRPIRDVAEKLSAFMSTLTRINLSGKIAGHTAMNTSLI